MDDRPSLFNDPPVLSDTLGDDVVDYRPVSPLAVVGAVLGLLAPVALMSSLLSLVPLAGAIVSWVAAVGVQRNQETKSGRGIAILGLVLSLVVLGALLVRGPLVQQLHTTDAEPLVERFIEAVQQRDWVTAHQLTLPYARRRPTEALAKLYYEGDQTAQEELQAFAEKPEIVRLAASEPKLLEQTETAGVRTGVAGAAWVYLLPEEDGQPATGLTIRLQRRDENLAGGAAWQINHVAFAPYQR